jgi:ABC-type multidrug transport system fused ATPase/permease subunit
MYFFANTFALFLETIILSRILSNIFAKLTVGRKDKELAKMFLMYICLFVLAKSAVALRNYTYDLIIPKFNKFVKIYLYNGIIDRYQIDYKEINLGYVLYNFQNLPSSFNRVIIEMLQEYIPNTIAVLICITYLCYINKAIGVVTLLTLVFIVVIMLYRARSNIDLSIQEHDLTEQDNEFVQDKLGNLFNIYTSGTTDLEKLEYSNLEDDLGTSMYNNYAYSTVTSMILEFSSIMVIMITFYVIYRSKKVSSASVLTIMVLMYYINYLAKTSSNLVSVVDIVGYVKQAEIFLSELNVSANSQTSVPGEATTGPSQAALRIQQELFSKQFDFFAPIVFDNVNYAYSSGLSKVQLFNDVSLMIEPGSKICVYGRSGSGKSTLFKLLLGFYTLDSGTITIGGTNIKDIPVDYLRKNISVVNQNIRLFDASVLENMLYGSGNNDGHGSAVVSEQDLQKTLTDLGILDSGIFANLKNGLQTNVGVGGANLSGGQKQIVGIVRALLKPGSIMLLDEPTSALDANTKRIVLDIIKKIKGRTIIIITHDNEVSKYMDKTYKLENGKIIAQK